MLCTVLRATLFHVTLAGLVIAPRTTQLLLRVLS